eukprot:COSAG05_NODE_142_length_16591_cov_6.726837_2_plen_181_part_00
MSRSWVRHCAKFAPHIAALLSQAGRLVVCVRYKSLFALLKIATMNVCWSASALAEGVPPETRSGRVSESRAQHPSPPSSQQPQPEPEPEPEAALAVNEVVASMQRKQFTFFVNSDLFPDQRQCRVFAADLTELETEIARVLGIPQSIYVLVHDEDFDDYFLPLKIAEVPQAGRIKVKAVK